uniref:Protein aurora borealis n=1 Tax=Jaculus jaculus TaxID=51337 RepID=A0A8C5LCB4_JACJA
MGDVNELKMQITPETPGRISVLNPFESPSDYSNLHEQTLASPSVFKSTKLPTPGEFRWSIDQLAAINPVEIDPEEIHRQASYLSHSQIDKDVEDKRQKAIEEFFTKDVIVPSPWTDHDGKQPSEQPANKFGCQTLLSLPVDFNLESILGDYFKTDEFAEQSPGNLSSSSLRRKLFLDGNGSISDSLPSTSPASPQGSAQATPEELFSSSPIQSNAKKYSLGSVTSPSPISSPTFSPVVLHIGKTPLSEQRKFTFHSPDASSGTNSNGITNPSIRSPYIDGCSPIKNWSPMNLGGELQYRTPLIRIPFTLETHSEDEEDKDHPTADASPSAARACGAHLVVTAVTITHSQCGASEKEPALAEDTESEENNTVDMVDTAETADESTWIKEPVDNGISSPMTDFVNGIAFSIENSHMCMSPLAESSVLPCESSNIQMDSGYNTQSCGSNIMDTVGAESYLKESDAQSFEVDVKSQACDTKQGHSTQKCWMKATSPQCSTP